MPDGGSINLRLSLKGAEQVRAELDKIGPAGSRMGRELDRAMRVPGPGLTALDAGVAHARGGIDGLSQRTGVLGAGLSALGPWGLAAAATLGAVAIAATAAIAQGREAMAFADEIDDAAQKLNVGTEALQEYRYAMTAVGGATADADAAIDGFQKKLGEAGAGGRSLKWFERLGFSAEDIRAFTNTEVALDAVLDKISTLGTEAERAAVAEKLGLGPMVALAREGSDRLAELRQEARDLGLVMDAELVRRGAEANQEFETMSRVLDVQLKSAFLDLGPVIVDLVGFLAWLAKGIADVADSWRRLEDRSSRGLERQDQRLATAQMRMLRGHNSPADLSPSERTVWDNINRQRARIAEERAERGSQVVDGPERPTTLIDVSGGGARGGQSQADRERQRRIQEAEREVERLVREDYTTQREWLRYVQAGRDTAQDRADAAVLLLGLDEEEARVALEKTEASIRAGGLMNEEVEHRLAQIRTLRQDVGAARRREIEERRAEEMREAMRAAEEQHLQLTSEILSLASSTARTSAERQTTELALLELAQRRQRADLEAAIAAEKEPAARARLAEALERLPALYAAQADDVRRRTAGPLGQWRESQIQSAGEASEWLQAASLNALDSVNGGLIDAYRNAENAGDALKRMGEAGVNALSQIADALLEVAIQRLMIQPLTNALFGGPTSSGNGLLGGLLGNFAGALFGGPSKLPGAQKKGFGRGGVNGAAGWAPVGEYGMELVDLPVGARIRDTDATQRTLLDFEARMRAMGAAGSKAAPTVSVPISVINQTSEPVVARTRPMSNGGYEVLLEPAVRSAVARMGADGSLADAHRLTPQPIRR